MRGSGTGLPTTTGMWTDRYELTMVDAARLDGVAEARSVFELFARRLPGGRRFGVVAGTDRLLAAIERFRFTDADVAHLERERVVSPSTLAWLADYRFRGEVHGLREGELYGPDTPVLTVEASFAEAVVLETVLLSIANHDTAVAGAASRIVLAAAGRDVVDMGTRRTHEAAAVDAARAAWIAGVAATSNLEAGRRFGLPTIGTAAHAFVLAHEDEQVAFTTQLARQGLGTTLLVDTFDIPTGVERAVAAARSAGGTGPGAIRIDSGDLADEARRARRQLDSLGATDTRVLVSGDLDEGSIAALVQGGAPIDAFGVGTALVTGSGHPTADFVYKLVAIEDRAGGLRPVAKVAAGKGTHGGRKLVRRVVERDRDGRVTDVHDHVRVEPARTPAWPEGARAGTPGGTPGDRTAVVRPLQVPLVRGGEVVHRPTLAEIRAHHRAALAELPAAALDLVPGPPVVGAARPEGG